MRSLTVLWNPWELASRQRTSDIYHDSVEKRLIKTIRLLACALRVGWRENQIETQVDDAVDWPLAITPRSGDNASAWATWPCNGEGAQPMSRDNSFDALMTRLRAGDEDAANELFHLFASRLIGLARRQLDRRIRQKVDAEDVVQSVFKSFFLRHANGKFELSNWDNLWAFGPDYPAEMRSQEATLLWATPRHTQGDFRSAGLRRCRSRLGANS